MGEDQRAPRVLFVGSAYAGHRTRFLNLQAHAGDDSRIRPVFRTVTGWKDGGLLERLPLPGGVRGRARALVESRAFATLPRPDVLWTSAADTFLPWTWTQAGPLGRPMLVDLDSTVAQLEAMAPIYFGRPPRTGWHGRYARTGERLLARAPLATFTPWSRWAADGLRAAGVPDDRIVVIPPGVDLELWSAPKEREDRSGPLRLLFVGGDFERKGGQILVDLLRGPLAGRCELDVVTYAPVQPEPGVRIHHAGPNSDELRSLFSRADLFVLPTRAECFGIAAVEAMASGLPVLMGNVGGAEDIVTPGETGWLVQPEHSDVYAALECALQQRDHLASMGARARHVAECRFDGRRNDRAIVDLALEVHQRRRTGNQRGINGQMRQPRS